MENLGLNTDVVAGDRRLHVQTFFSPQQSRIVSNVFEDGRVIVTREVATNGETSADSIKGRMADVHREVGQDLESLFRISEKVKTVQHPVSFVKLGKLFLRYRLIDEAIEHFTRAIDLDSKYAEAYDCLGQAYFQQEDYDKAIAVFEKGMEFGGKYADINYHAGQTHDAKGDFQKARERLQRALKVNPRFDAANFAFGLSILRELSQKDPESWGDEEATQEKVAVEHLLRSCEISPHYRNKHFDKGFDLLKQGKVKRAVKEFERALDMHPSLIDMDFEAEFYIKFMFGGKGKDEQLISKYIGHLTGALKEYPNYADLHNNLGVAYLIQCRNLFLKALDEFRKALRINPTFKRAEKNLKLAENDGKGFLILLRAIMK